MPIPPRRWFAFRLRTLFVVAILALPLGWAAYSLHWISLRHGMLEAHNAKPKGSPNPDFAPIVAPGLLWIFGERGVYVLKWTPASAESVDELHRTFPESKIRVYANEIDATPAREIAPK